MKSNVLAIFCIILCLLFTINISAQERDFKRFIGGNISIEALGRTQSDNKNISYSIAPTFGVFVSEKIVAGVGVGYQGRFTSNFNQKEKTSFVFVNPFVRFRIPVGEKLGFYTELDLSVGVEFGKVENPITVINLDPAIRSGIHAGPGMDYRFADHWFFTVKWGILGFDTYKIIDNEGFEYRAGFNFDTSNLLFGLNYSF
jgi:flagellar assembly factor FliW